MNQLSRVLPLKRRATNPWRGGDGGGGAGSGGDGGGGDGGGDGGGLGGGGVGGWLGGSEGGGEGGVHTIDDQVNPSQVPPDCQLGSCSDHVA